MKKQLYWVALAAAVLALGACGGGDDPVPAPKAYVAGDSLNDVGVFGGARFTVQSSTPGKPYLVWPEHVSNAYNLGALCAAYNGLAAFASVANCTGYAIGGAQINPVSLVRTSGLVTGATIGSDASPLSIVKQLADMGTGRTFGSKDLIMVDGGGNDANALALSLFEGLAGNPQAIVAYKTVLKDLLPSATVDAVPNNDAANLVNLGGAYMQAAATMLSNAVKANLIAKGAQRVVLLNLPDLSKTPALNTQPAQAKAIVDGWAQAMNAQLQTELGSEPKVAIINFYATLNGFVANPNSAVVGSVVLSNATNKACGTTSITSCTDTLLDASGPAGWRTHLFADDLHATPFGNELTAQAVRTAISGKGWTF